MPVVSGPSTTDLIVTPAEVAAHAGAGELDAADEDAVEQQVALYQADLESILGRGVTVATRVESVTLPLYADRWLARRGPVQSIASVTSGDEVLVAGTGYVRNRHGAEVWGGAWLPSTELVVTYVGGWDVPDNAPARSAILARTARWLNKRADDDVGVETSTVEGHSTKWMPDAFTEAELRACNRLRAPDMAG